MEETLPLLLLPLPLTRSTNSPQGNCVSISNNVGPKISLLSSMRGRSRPNAHLFFTMTALSRSCCSWSE